MTIVTAGDTEGLSLLGLGRITFTIGLAYTHPWVIAATSNLYAVSSSAYRNDEVSKFYGTDLTYDAAGYLAGGVVTRWEAWGPTYENPSDAMRFSFEGFSIPATTVESWMTKRDGPEYDDPNPLLGGDDSITGSAFHDFGLVGYGGNDTISGGAGDDWLVGGSGIQQDPLHPQIHIPVDPLHDGSNVLRGGDGNDAIWGGAGFDDINGNQGNDEALGYGGDDWVLGGQGDDILMGDTGQNAASNGMDKVLARYGDNGASDGADFLQGNLGNDTCDGEGGNDTIHGGQGNDVLYGSAGNDWLYGDRGDDTETGGAGADQFHSFGEAGTDKVLDFNYAEGDRVVMAPGSQYTTSQVGADTVVNMTGGGQVILVGVQLSSLGDGWIISA